MFNELRVSKDKTNLVLCFDNGPDKVLSAAFLRENARDADSLRAKHDGKFQLPEQNITITDVKPMGHNSLNIQFSDGHIRAIYPFHYLIELSDSERQ